MYSFSYKLLIFTPTADWKGEDDVKNLKDKVFSPFPISCFLPFYLVFDVKVSSSILLSSIIRCKHITPAIFHLNLVIVIIFNYHVVDS